jgi:hypothetical protein
MKYQVGALGFPAKDDPFFDDLQQASNLAETQSITKSETHAVWDEDGNAIEIWHIGECFKK